MDHNLSTKYGSYLLPTYYFYYKNRSSHRLIKHVLNLKGIFVNGTMKPAGSRAVVAPTMAGMMEEVTDCGSSCRIHIFRRVPRAAATCLISARVELPSLHPPPHGLPLAAAAARPGPATSTTLRSLPPPQEIKAQGRVGKLSSQWGSSWLVVWVLLGCVCYCYFSFS